MDTTYGDILKGFRVESNRKTSEDMNEYMK